MTNIELNSLTLEELKDYMYTIGEKRYRGEQLFTYIHGNQGNKISEITVFSKGVRDKLERLGKISQMKIYRRFDSKLDSTRKYLFLLEDDNIIEGVAMEYQHGWTACISAQVGCRMGCVFCASTKGGLVRNLSAGEMTNQIYTMEKDLNVRISNIVLMGSGEPLDNYENILKFLKIIHDEKGHNTSYRNITLSTCGIVPKIYMLADEGLPITLSISLHSPFDETRKRIMPIGNRYNIDEIIEACKYYYDKTGRRITIEYTLIEGVNDSLEDINQLKKLLHNLNCHVNLIPLNPIEEFDRARSSDLNISRFKKELTKANISVTIRREMGGDINAACGQLRRRYTEDIR